MKDSPIIWVTGAGGFTGQHLVAHIRQVCPKARIVGIGRSRHTAIEVDVMHRLDLNNPTAVSQLAKDSLPDYIFHLAGAMPPLSDEEMWVSNVSATYNLLTGLFISGHQPTRIISVGSAAEYLANETGEYTESCAIGGHSGYGRSKSAQTQISLLTASMVGLDLVVARPFNLIGPGLSENLVLGKVCRTIAKGDSVLKLGRLDAERDFIDVRDAVAAYWLLLEHGKSGETYNVCSAIPLKIMKLVEMAISFAGREIQVEFNDAFKKASDLDRNFGRYERIKTVSGWSPAISIDQSIKDMLRSY